MTGGDWFQAATALHTYRPVLSIARNRKGVVDCDTVKGCVFGMAEYPGCGCYGDCYAAKTAKMYGIRFEVSVLRQIPPGQTGRYVAALFKCDTSWYRIGVSGDPSFDWEHTVDTCERLACTKKTAVIVTKHWQTMSDYHAIRLRSIGAVINTSVSGMDTDAEIMHRCSQHDRLVSFGVRAVKRVVTCFFGNTEWGRRCAELQRELLSTGRSIDNPFRPRASNPLVMNGDVVVCRRPDSVGGGTLVSVHDESVYLGHCSRCPDRCGITMEGK